MIAYLRIGRRERIRAATFAVVLYLASLLTACRTTTPDSEHGSDKTAAFYLKVESSVPGVTIETNNVFAGKTPLTLRIFGDSQGSTFHNFGSPEYVLRALPLTTNQFLQTRVFKTGKGSAPGEKIPGLIFFDMSQQSGGLIIDTFPDK
jgi:hypothetical protein